MKFVFFDFDGTITKRDTFIEFAKFSLGKKYLFRAIVKNSLNLILWKLGLRSNSRTKQQLFSTLYKGMEYERFKVAGVRFKEIIESQLRPDALNKIRKHKTEGHTVVIVSASIPEWIAPWASANGIDMVIGTEIEVDTRGIITGKFISPNCYGEEKAKRIRTIFPDIDNCESWGYGDSAGDNYMLEMVTHPLRVKL